MLLLTDAWVFTELASQQHVCRVDVHRTSYLGCLKEESLCSYVVNPLLAVVLSVLREKRKQMRIIDTDYRGFVEIFRKYILLERV